MYFFQWSGSIVPGYKMLSLYIKMLSVINRKGEKEPVDFSRIHNRIKFLAEEVKPVLRNIDAGLITRDSVQGISEGASVSMINEYAASVASNMVALHYEYDTIAARLLINDLQKNIRLTFGEKAERMHNHYVPIRRGSSEEVDQRHSPLISDEYYDFVRENRERIEREIRYDRDYNWSYAGVIHMKKKYLIRTEKDEFLETPADMYMRVALGIHIGRIDKAIHLYDLMSRGLCIHATPTLYNAGTRCAQLSSCFLIGSKDTTEGIMKTASDCAIISKHAGGVGIHNDWRGNNSYINTSRGRTNGKLPFFTIYGKVAKAFDQGGGKRKGSFAIYEKIFDTEIIRFLNMRRITGDAKDRDHALFPAIWIPDLFMERLEQNGMWSLFSSDECPELFTTTGAEFNRLYLEYEEKQYFRKQVTASSLFTSIMNSKIESGIPYVLYGDHANEYSNQKNLGVIHSSNLCAEIIMYSDENEYGTCNLASICLGRFVHDAADGGDDEFPEKPYFDFDELSHVVGSLVESLNAVIDNNWYPLPETKKSNFNHRPIGIGVQGLADVFAKFHVPFDSEEARLLNKQIFECIYYQALAKSTAMARISKSPYSTFAGSPLSKGIFRWQLSGLTEDDLVMKDLDWGALRASIMKYGVRNSLLVALMPTSSTSFLMNQVECFEPIKINFGTRRDGCGVFWSVNKYLINDLIKLGLYDKNLGQNITMNNGSIQHLPLPSEFLRLYKTAFEYDQADIVRLAADRQHFVDQSQSLNLYGPAMPDSEKLKNLHVLGWKQKLVTGSYYYHQLAMTKPIPFTVNTKDMEVKVAELMAGAKVNANVFVNDCEMCGS